MKLITEEMITKAVVDNVEPLVTGDIKCLADSLNQQLEAKMGAQEGIALMEWVRKYADEHDCFIDLKGYEDKWYLNIIHNDGVVMFFVFGEKIEDVVAECALKIAKAQEGGEQALKEQ